MKCKISGCFSPIKYKKSRLCNAHYQRFEKNGHYDLIPRKKKLEGSCHADGCDLQIDRLKYCDRHYMQFWRTGSPCTKKRKESYVQSAGYIRVLSPDHPMADTSGYAYQHRVVYFDANGHGPFPCYWCSKSVDWPDLHIDHVNSVVSDNDLSNLVASCHGCNTGRGREKRINSLRKKYGHKYRGRLYTGSDLARMVGISSSAMSSRLKVMSVEEAATTPKGPTGPKPKNNCE